MKAKITKLLLVAVTCFIASIGIIGIFDPSRLSQVKGDWGRKFGYYDFAIECYSNSIHIDSRRPGAFNSRGVAWHYKRHPEEAIKDYDRAIDLDPQYALV